MWQTRKSIIFFIFRISSKSSLKNCSIQFVTSSPRVQLQKFEFCCGPERASLLNEFILAWYSSGVKALELVYYFAYL